MRHRRQLRCSPIGPPQIAVEAAVGARRTCDRGTTAGGRQRFRLDAAIGRGAQAENADAKDAGRDVAPRRRELDDKVIGPHQPFETVKKRHLGERLHLGQAEIAADEDIGAQVAGDGGENFGHRDLADIGGNSTPIDAHADPAPPPASREGASAARGEGAEDEARGEAGSAGDAPGATESASGTSSGETVAGRRGVSARWRAHDRRNEERRTSLGAGCGTSRRDNRRSPSNATDAMEGAFCARNFNLYCASIPTDRSRWASEGRIRSGPLRRAPCPPSIPPAIPKDRPPRTSARPAPRPKSLPPRAFGRGPFPGSRLPPRRVCRRARCLGGVDDGGRRAAGSIAAGGTGVSRDLRRRGRPARRSAQRRLERPVASDRRGANRRRPADRHRLAAHRPAGFPSRSGRLRIGPISTR